MRLWDVQDESIEKVCEVQVSLCIVEYSLSFKEETDSASVDFIVYKTLKTSSHDCACETSATQAPRCASGSYYSEFRRGTVCHTWSTSPTLSV